MYAAQVISVSMIIAVCLPSDALAWGASMHLHLAEAALANSGHIAPAVAAVGLRFPQLFYYGSIAADLILGKHVGIEYEQHSHNWNLAFDLLDSARGDQQKALSWGYLTHLAADVIAHNVFVPTKLAVHGPMAGAAHTLWEFRFESLVGDHLLDLIRSLRVGDTRDADRFLADFLPETLFTHNTNRRLFNGMLWAQHSPVARGAVRALMRRNDFVLNDDDRGFYMDYSLRAVADLLINGRDAKVTEFDPVGLEALERAKIAYRSGELFWNNRRAVIDEKSAKARKRVRYLYSEPLERLPDHCFQDVG